MSLRSTKGKIRSTKKGNSYSSVRFDAWCLKRRRRTIVCSFRNGNGNEGIWTAQPGSVQTTPKLVILYIALAPPLSTASPYLPSHFYIYYPRQSAHHITLLFPMYSPYTGDRILTQVCSGIMSESFRKTITLRSALGLFFYFHAMLNHLIIQLHHNFDGLGIHNCTEG